MADRDKVINALECCYCNFPKQMDCKNCPYDKICYHDKACSLMLRDALALLKEQDAELSYRYAKTITHTATKLDDETCPSCGNVIRVRYDYCHYCGQKLDWEGR